MVVARFPPAGAFANRIVSVLAPRRLSRGVGGRITGGEVNADAEDAAEKRGRRVDRDVSERGVDVR